MGVCPAMDYVYDVLAGRIVACSWVKLACQRHLNLLKNGHEQGYYFDEDAAWYAIDIFDLFCHYEGEWAGSAIVLEAWQQFIVWYCYGWMTSEGFRLVRVMYIEVARKNGKTTWAAGLGLFMMVFDGEAGAQVYSAATKRDQARIAHKAATQMVKKSPALRETVVQFRDNLHVVDTASKFEPLGKDADTVDGLNVHCAVVDELHAHKSRDMWDVLDTATGARRESMIIAITTAGFDRTSVCYELHQYTQKILQGVVVDHAFFGIIYTLDLVDDGKGGLVLENWDNEKVWIKANPNLGVSKYIEDLRRKAVQAKVLPTALNNFLRKELNVWTQSFTKWLPWDRWNACGNIPVDVEKLKGKRCFGGLDLASVSDYTAFVLVFPPDNPKGVWFVLWWFWIPEFAFRERQKRYVDNVTAWERDGFLTMTDGNATDYDEVVETILNLNNDFDIVELAYDTWGASSVAQNLMNGGVTVVPTRQGFMSFNAPTKETEILVKEGRLAHGSHPVGNWMSDNVVVVEDSAGNLKPDKSKSAEKIDGIVALIMAVGRGSAHVSKDSVYNKRGVREVG